MREANLSSTTGDEHLRLLAVGDEISAGEPGIRVDLELQGSDRSGKGDTPRPVLLRVEQLWLDCSGLAGMVAEVSSWLGRGAEGESVRQSSSTFWIGDERQGTLTLSFGGGKVVRGSDESEVKVRIVVGNVDATSRFVTDQAGLGAWCFGLGQLLERSG